jgi:hypothetical protein
VEEHLTARDEERSTRMRLRKTLYSLGSLMVLAMAVSASWKNY